MGFDLRSTEKNIQLYNQLSGRAGRFSKESIVIYQTFNPSDETLKNILENNYKQNLISIFKNKNASSNTDVFTKGNKIEEDILKSKFLHQILKIS